MKSNKEQLRKNAYIDYIQLERRLNRVLKNNKSIYDWYLYIRDLNVELFDSNIDKCLTFDFKYKNMLLTIRFDFVTGYINLEEEFELFGEDIHIMDLEKEVLGYKEIESEEG